MPDVLITGENGYIGTAAAKRMSEAGWHCERMSLRGGLPDNADLSRFDCIIHAAGIVHRKYRSSDSELYFNVNCRLTDLLARRAKQCGVKHFIYLSTMSVYGKTTGRITASTNENPRDEYGVSKLMAEKRLSELEDAGFTVTILRPPMVYGENCPGNFAALRKYSARLPFFPSIKNERSMLYIGNLCECLLILAGEREGGIFFPQDSEYIATRDMVTIAAEAAGKSIRLTGIFNPLLKLLSRGGKLSKIFGSLTYDREMSALPADYAITPTDEAIARSCGIGGEVGKVEKAEKVNR